MRLMIRNVAIDTEAVTRRISSFFRHRILKYSDGPRGLMISITTSTTPSKLQFDTGVDDQQNESHDPMTFTKLRIMFD